MCTWVVRMTGWPDGMVVKGVFLSCSSAQSGHDGDATIPMRFGAHTSGMAMQIIAARFSGTSPAGYLVVVAKVVVVVVVVVGS